MGERLWTSKDELEFQIGFDRPIFPNGKKPVEKQRPIPPIKQPPVERKHIKRDGKKHTR